MLLLRKAKTILSLIRDNKNISHQLFDYTITFVNSQHQNTNSKGDFVRSFQRFLVYKNKSDSDLVLRIQ